MPPSARRTRPRREIEAPDGSEPDVLDSSPSRPLRKKRRTDNPAAAATPTLGTEPTHVNEHAKKGTNVEKNSADTMEEVIASLTLPADSLPLVAADHANKLHEKQHRNGVQAYAKIAGKDWTYYVKSLKINLGRPPDAARPNDPSAGATGDDPALTDDEENKVHIDLGPSKLVSRHHATIEYVPDGELSWLLKCHGRNGVRVDDTHVTRDAQKRIASGAVIEIGGTQMMFVTPDDEPQIHPMFIQQAQDEARGVTAHMQKVGRGPRGKGLSMMDLPPSSDQSRHGGNSSGVVHMNENLPGTPTANRSGRATVAHHSPSYSRGLNLESTENIDYSLDSSKDLKPPFSYATMISQAILSAPDEKLTLNSIYSWIMDKYAFYRFTASGWQNSIRHNLSLNKAFEKIPRRTHEPGKGMKWQIIPECRAEFVEKSSRPSKGAAGQRTSSVPTSPVVRDLGAALGQGASSHRRQTTESASITRNQRSSTPPIHRTSEIAYTPTRGPLPHRQNGRIPTQDSSPIRANGRSFGGPINNSAILPAYATSPTEKSPSYIDESSTQPMVTPAPRRHNPTLAPPSNTQLPSSFMALSSPAPFWKFPDLASTPARPLGDYSPFKMDNMGADSSPPAARRLSEAGSPKPSVASKPAETIIKKENGPETSVEPIPKPVEEEPAQGGFDLTKGFQAIGKYHTNLANAS